MFYVIQIILFSFSFFIYYFPQKKLAGKIQKINKLEILFYAFVTYFISNVAVFLSICFKDGRTPLLVFTKLTHFYVWKLFTLKFFISFLIATSVCALVFYFLRIHLSEINVKKNQAGNITIYVLSFIFLLGAFILLLGTFWCKGRFPMDSPETVYYTMGNEANVVDYSIFVEAAIFVSISFFFAVFFLVVPIAIAKYHKTHSVAITIHRKKFHFVGSSVHFVLSAMFCIFIIVSSIILLHSFEYAKIVLNKISKPLASDFYKNEYVEPRYDNIIFPESKRNLIVIFLESMETSYADFSSGGLFEKNMIPNLTRVASENISFSNNNLLGGGIDVAGTGWTVAAMLSKFSGLPFQLPRNRRQNIGFLPNAITLTDVLAENGYRQIFLFGSKKKFASRDLLLETHGGVEIHDIDWYKENGLLEKNYHAFWGFEDAKLFEYARYELENLSQSDTPFMFGMLTVDTHMPDGYICELCDTDEKWQMKNVIACADRQIGNFLDWAEKQSWYEDTAIVIVGDHLFMTGDNTDFFKEEMNDDEVAIESASHVYKPSNERRWLNLFINATPSVDTLAAIDDFDGRMNKHLVSSMSHIFQNRNFSSFDIFPTILSALGCQIKNNRLGFGIDLFSGEKTLLERYKLDYINEELVKKNIQYENLAGNLNGKRKD